MLRGAFATSAAAAAAVVEAPLCSSMRRRAEHKRLGEAINKPMAAQPSPIAAMTGSELIAAQELVRKMPVGEQVLEGILQLVRAGRPGGEDAIPNAVQHLEWGPGPRAAQALMLASRARALLQGRYAPSLDDVIALAQPVLRHRIALTYVARAEGIVAEDVIETLVQEIR